MKMRFSSPVLWIVALAITLGLAGYQRRTGPSHPFRGEVRTGGRRLEFKLPRSHGGSGGMVVRLDPAGVRVGGAEILWRRYPTREPWRRLPMGVRGGRFEAEIPHQPPAGKVEYRVILHTPAGEVSLPSGQTVVARFRGAVPAWLLAPHILCMFLGMLLATRGLLEVLFRGRDRGRGLVLAATALLVLGGLLLGPLVQLHAFGALWTGWPFGGDLTDNKTLFAIALWLPAAVAAWRRRQHPWLLAFGWTAMMVVFLIPHSMRGSQVDWSQVQGASPAAASTEESSGSGQREGSLHHGTVREAGRGGGLDASPSPDHHAGAEGDVTPHHEGLAGDE